MSIMTTRSVRTIGESMGTPSQSRSPSRRAWPAAGVSRRCGNVEAITARHGNALHIRPKAANGSVLTDALDEEGNRIKTRPRGFYLRKTFTQDILAREFYDS